MNRLSQIRVVMVNTTHPGNIGAAARAMKNMGLSDLALVSPKFYPNEEATARAAGAQDVLDAAKICDSLEEAIGDCELIIGASARLRSITWPQLDPRECASTIMNSSVRTAILFGREHSGLTNDELERCHYLLHIPSDPNYSSLNVAAALQVVAYEIFYAAQSLTNDKTNERVRYATAEEMESFFVHLESMLEAVGFLHATKHRVSLMRRLRRIFNRTRLEYKEVHILRGGLKSIVRRLSKT